MLKRIEIPKDLWEFVGQKLDNFGCIKVDNITEEDFSSYYEPKIRWLLLGDEDWNNYCSGIELCSPYQEKDKRLAEKAEGLVHLYIRESIKQEKPSEKFSERKKMMVKRGFITFDNVILMHEKYAKEILNEANEKFLNPLQEPLNFSMDSIRFELLIQELINIYKLQFGKYFVCQENNPCVVNAKIFDTLNNVEKIKFKECFGCQNNYPCFVGALIMADYFESHSKPAKQFKLNFRSIPKSHQLKEFQLRENIWKALVNKKPIILKDKKGKILIEFNVGKLFELDKQNINISLGSGLKTKKNLVGFSHILFDHSILHASDVQEVNDAWNWIMGRINVNRESLESALETCSLSMLLWCRENDLQGISIIKDFSIFSFFVNLYKLEKLGVNTDKKIREYEQQIKGHIKKFGEFEDASWKKIFHVQNLRNHLYNFSSECLLARTAKTYGYSIELDTKPDVIIENMDFEVKRDNSNNISNGINSAMEQKHDVIAIEVDNLNKKEIPHFGSPVYDITWLNEGNLRDVLKTILQMKFDGEKILLFNQTINGLRARIILIKENIL